MKGVLRALTENEASTDPGSVDERLRGRTYTIPFDPVWKAAVGLAGGELSGWKILSADDRAGTIYALVRTRLTGSETDVRVSVGLDQNAQTRVDLASSSRTGRGDLGRARRHIGRFLARLDEALKAEPGQVLDPVTMSAYLGHS